MSDLRNLPNAIVILGTIYLYLIQGLDGLITFIICLFCFGTWAIITGSDLRKEYAKAQIDLLKAKAEYYRRKE